MNNVPIKDDELYHWKYLHRERVNGKWRYYYKKDDNKLSVGRVSKDKLKKRDNDNQYGVVTTKKDGLSTNKIVDKKTYKDTKTGYRLFVEDTPLRKINKHNIRMGKKFIDDLITGGLYKKKK